MNEKLIKVGRTLISRPYPITHDDTLSGNGVDAPLGVIVSAVFPEIGKLTSAISDINNQIKEINGFLSDVNDDIDTLFSAVDTIEQKEKDYITSAYIPKEDGVYGLNSSGEWVNIGEVTATGVDYITEDIKVTNPMGLYQKGETIVSGTKYNDIFHNILTIEQKGTVSISLSPDKTSYSFDISAKNTPAGEFTVKSSKIKFTNGDNPFTEYLYKVGSDTYGPYDYTESAVAMEGFPITSSSTLSISVSATDGKNTYTPSTNVSVQYIEPYYYGVIANVMSNMSDRIAKATDIVESDDMSSCERVPKAYNNDKIAFDGADGMYFWLCMPKQLKDICHAGYGWSLFEDWQETPISKYGKTYYLYTCVKKVNSINEYILKYK